MERTGKAGKAMNAISERYLTALDYHRYSYFSVLKRISQLDLIRLKRI